MRIHTHTLLPHSASLCLLVILLFFPDHCSRVSSETIRPYPPRLRKATDAAIGEPRPAAYARPLACSLRPFLFFWATPHPHPAPIRPIRLQTQTIARPIGGLFFATPHPHPPPIRPIRLQTLARPIARPIGDFFFFATPHPHPAPIRPVRLQTIARPIARPTIGDLFFFATPHPHPAPVRPVHFKHSLARPRTVCTGRIRRLPMTSGCDWNSAAKSGPLQQLAPRVHFGFSYFLRVLQFGSAQQRGCPQS